MDDRERDNFYSFSSDDDDGDDYELEPPDPDVLAAEARRGEAVYAESRRAIDIDEIYRDADHSRSTEILNNWVRNFRFRFRFQVKHLLVATAVLAILLTIRQYVPLGTVFVVLVMLSVIGVYLYLQWQDKRHQDEVAARREEIYARRRAEQANAAANPTAEPPRRSAAAPLRADEVDEAWREALERRKFRFQFSMAQMLTVMACAAVALGLANALGGAQNAATMLGFVALAGLIAYAAGYNPPAIVTLAWWLLLVFYVAFSIITVVWNAV